MGARVIGLGQASAGDDGVGHAVIDALEKTALPQGTELIRVRDASALVSLVTTPLPVILVDAVVGANEVGEVRVFDDDALDATAPSGVSTHGIGVLQALELARALDADEVTPSVRFVTVSIEAPRAYREGLSEAVAAAVPRACAVILEALEA